MPWASIAKFIQGVKVMVWAFVKFASLDCPKETLWRCQYIAIPSCASKCAFPLFPAVFNATYLDKGSVWGITARWSWPSRFCPSHFSAKIVTLSMILLASYNPMVPSLLFLHLLALCQGLKGKNIWQMQFEKMDIFAPLPNHEAHSNALQSAILRVCLAHRWIATCLVAKCCGKWKALLQWHGMLKEGQNQGQDHAWDSPKALLLAMATTITLTSAGSWVSPQMALSSFFLLYLSIGHVIGYPKFCSRQFAKFSGWKTCKIWLICPR